MAAVGATRSSGRNFYEFENEVRMDPPERGQFALPAYFTRRTIVGDGHCCFRSMSVILFNTESRHRELRTRITAFICSNFSHYRHKLIVGHERFFRDAAQYKDFMDPTDLVDQVTWGGFPELEAFSSIYRVALIVWKDDKRDFFHTINYEADDFALSNVEYSQGFHFNVLKPELTSTTRISSDHMWCGDATEHDARGMIIPRSLDMTCDVRVSLEMLFRARILQCTRRDYMELLIWLDENEVGLPFSERHSRRTSVEHVDLTDDDDHIRLEPEVHDKKHPQSSTNTCSKMQVQKPSLPLNHHDRHSAAKPVRQETREPTSKCQHIKNAVLRGPTTIITECRVPVDVQEHLIKFGCRHSLLFEMFWDIERSDAFDTKRTNFVGVSSTVHQCDTVQFHFKFQKVVFNGFSYACVAALFRDYLINSEMAGTVAARYKKNFEEECFSGTVEDLRTILDFMSKAQPFRPLMIERYEKEIRDGPFHMCQWCSLLYFRIQGVLKSQRFMCHKCTKTCSWDISEFRTPHVKLNDVPSLLESLSPLEERLVCPYIPFLQMRSLHITKQHALKGHVVLVPHECIKFTRLLPNVLTDIETVSFHLKRKLSYKSDYMAGLLRPRVVRKAVKHLVVSCEFYKRHGIAALESRFTSLEESIEEINRLINELDHDLDRGVDYADDVPMQADTSILYHVPQSDPLLNTTLVSAPCEFKKPRAIWQTAEVEELCFPSLFGGKAREIVYSADDKPLSFKEIVKQEWLHADRRFARRPDNIFFKFYLDQVKQIHSLINIRGRQQPLRMMNAQQLQDENVLENLFQDNIMFNEFKKLRGSPDYWTNVKKDIFGFLRQNKRSPTFFVSLSMADTRWFELLDTLRLFDSGALKGKAIDEMTYDEKCTLIRNDPITCARYFLHRRKALFKHILKGVAPALGEIADYFGVIEFQHRGSPHCHFMIWLKDPPSSSNPTEVVRYIDNLVSCDSDILPEELRDVQCHKHSHRCQLSNRQCVRKGSLTSCAFGFPRPPLDETMILAPLPTETTKEQRAQIRKKAAEVFKFLEGEIESDLEFDEFLRRLQFTSKDAYLQCLRSTIERETIFHRRKVRDRYVNPFNIDILLRWRANMDIQYCLHPYAVANYIASYMCKGNKHVSKILAEMKKVFHNNCDISFGEGLRQLGYAILKEREVSVQEAVFLTLGLPLRFASRSVVFINTGFPDDRILMLKSKKEIDNLPAESMDIFKPYALVAEYQRRPHSMHDVCLADFAAWYDLYSAKLDGFEDECHEADDVENNTTRISRKLHKRTIPKIIRCVGMRHREEVNDFQMWEEVLLFVPFRDERQELLPTKYIELYNKHRQSIEKKREEYFPNHLDWEDLLNEVASAYVGDTSSSDEGVPEDQANATDIGDMFPEKVDSVRDSCCLGQRRLLVEKPDDAQLEKDLLMLNEKQKGFVDHVMRHIRCNSDPFKLFLSGGAGVGKSVVVRVLFALMTKHFCRMCSTDSPQNIKVLKLAPTGVAAFNIDGSTIHYALRVPVKNEKSLVPLNPNSLAALVSELRDVEAIIIDEISMVGRHLLEYVDFRMQEVFCNRLPFGGKHVLFVGDFFQLRPVKDSFCFQSERSGNVHDLWVDVKLFELTEIMRQREEKPFASTLNRLREGLERHEDNDLITSFTIDSDRCVNKDEVMFMFADNARVDRHNTDLYNSKPAHIKYSIEKLDVQASGRRRKSSLSAVYSTSDRRYTGGLLSTLRIYIGCLVMVMLNVDTSDGIVNGACGTVRAVSCANDADHLHIPCERNEDSDDDDDIESLQELRKAKRKGRRPLIIWVAFMHEKVGRRCRATNRQYYTQYGIQNRNWTPIVRTSKKFSTSRGGHEVVRFQFPLYHRNATTIHKTQALTLDKAVVNFVGHMQAGMHYVALSRFRSMKDVKLLNYNPGEVSQSVAVVKEMRRMRASVLTLHPAIRIPQLISKSCDIVLFQNVRRLIRNVSNLLYTDLEMCDVICLNETHHEHVPHISITHQLQINHSSLKGGSLCFARGDIQNPEIHVHATCEVLSFLRHNVQHVFVYRYQNTSITSFVDFLCGRLWSFTATRVLIYGDFNIPWNKMECRSVFSRLHHHGFYQLVQFATHDRNNIIDHVWANFQDGITVNRLETYYSDHIPIEISLLI